jgi:glutathione S-transferase
LKDWAGIPLHEFPHLNAWVDRIVARPACEKGRHVPKPHTALENRNKTQEELDKAAAETRAWVQQSMAEDAKK